MTKNELYHYGVLGMKWGVRKNPDYKYTSWNTKSLSKRAAKLKGKADSTNDSYKKQKLLKRADSANRFAKRSAELDRREEQYARSVSTGRHLAARCISPIGSKTYVRALGALGGTDRSNPYKKAVAAGVALARYTVPFVGGIPYMMLMGKYYSGDDSVGNAIDKLTRR